MKLPHSALAVSICKSPEKMSKAFAKKVSKEGGKGYREKERERFWEAVFGKDFSRMLDLSHLWIPENYFWEG